MCVGAILSEAFASNERKAFWTLLSLPIVINNKGCKEKGQDTVDERIERGSTVTRWSLILVAAQIADVLTTSAVFAAFPGATEANPMMAAVQAHLGSAWWLPKMALACALVVLVGYRPRRRLVLAIGFVSTTPALLNLANIFAGMIHG